MLFRKKSEKSSYSGWSKKKLFVAYVILAIIVYLLIYWLFARGEGSGLY